MRVLIDLTDIEQWSGSHGGIQRVVYGVAKGFFLEKRKYELSFISFSDRHKAFYYSDFQPIYERVEALNNSQILSEETSVSIRHQIRLRIRRHVPETIRKNKVARKAAKMTVNSLKAARGAMREQKTVPLENQVRFDRDDIVLILGKPWDNLGIQGILSLEKQKTGFKLVQVVYDLIIPLYPHLHHPTLFESYSKHMFEAVAASDLMLPISKSSDRDLSRFCKLLKLTMPPTQVIRLGDNIADEAKLKKAEKPDVRVGNEFVLCVGTVEIRKNHNLLYYLYKLAFERGIELPQLIIVGSKGWLSHDVQYLIEHDPEIRKKIIPLSNISDAGLHWLYKNCQFTVYPSMYEGWGLPIAESLSYGKVCICSKTSSMPEIAGDLLDYFSPYNTEECLALMQKYIDKDNRSAKEKQVKDSYRSYTWDQTYKQVAEALQRIKK